MWRGDQLGGRQRGSEKCLSLAWVDGHCVGDGNGGALAQIAAAPVDRRPGVEVQDLAMLQLKREGV